MYAVRLEGIFTGASIALALAFSAGSAPAAPPLNDEAAITANGPGPWDGFAVANSTRALLRFQRSLGATKTEIPIEFNPYDPLAASLSFRIARDGSPCTLGTPCNGSLVTLTTVGNPAVENKWLLEIVDSGNPPEGSGTAVFELLVEGMPLSTTGGNVSLGVGPTVNAPVEYVQADPYLTLTNPSPVPASQPTISIDTAGSHGVFKPAGSPHSPPVTYDYEQINVTPIFPTTVTWQQQSGPVGIFDNPNTGQPELLSFRVTTRHGSFEISEDIDIIIEQPPVARDIDLVLAMDVSGSMGWHRTGSAEDYAGGCCSRLASAKSAARYFLNRLASFDPSCRAGVAIFPGTTDPGPRAGVRFAPSSGLTDGAQMATLVSAVGAETVSPCRSRLHPAGPGRWNRDPTGVPIHWNWTPTRSGLNAAKSMFPAPLGNRKRNVVLLSDGAWNVGKDPGNKIWLQTNFPNIRIHTVGMGILGADDVNFDSLQDIRTYGKNGGYFVYNLGDAQTEPNLMGGVDKILAGIVNGQPIIDPAETIRPGETRRHPFRVTSHDVHLSATVAWESSAEDLLDVHLLDPGGKRFDPQESGGGYRNVTLDQSLLAKSSSPGEWTLVVSHTRGASGVGDLVYSYGVLSGSSLKMLARLEHPSYVTGQSALLGVRIFEGSELLRGATVEATVERPRESSGAWHARNTVGAAELAALPDVISGEPLSPLDKKLVHLAQQGVALPASVLEPVVRLRDDGLGADQVAGDGLYTTRLDAFRIPGVHRIRLRATGATREGEAFTRENEIHRYVDLGMSLADLTDSLEFLEPRPGEHFPGELLELLQSAPPPGFRRTLVKVTPRGPGGVPWGPGRAERISFEVENATRLLAPVDLLDGSYVQLLDVAKGETASLVVLAGEVVSERVVIPE